MNQDIEVGKVFRAKDDSDEIVAAIPSDGTTRYYECAFLCCDNPVCTCGVIHINFSSREDQDLNDPNSSYQVDIDVVLKQLAYQDESKVSKEQMAFADLVLSSMDKNDFQILWKIYFEQKNEKTEQAPIDSIEAVFDFQEIEENGLMYFYRDVLPYGDVLIGRLKGEECLLLDQYCLKPKCSCTDATLTFVKNVEELKQTDKALLTLAVDYRKKKWSVVVAPTASVDVGAVKAAIEDQIPDFYKKLLKRHFKLKNIYAHCKKRHFKEQPLQLPKVGRNDPCPCGSGKKYKKCCM